VSVSALANMSAATVVIQPTRLRLSELTLSIVSMLVW